MKKLTTIKLTTPEYDEFYEFDTVYEAKCFLFGGMDIDDCDHDYSLKKIISLQDEYILDEE